MLKVVKANFVDLQDEYPVFYRQIFKKNPNPNDCPTYIYLVYEDEKYIGFASGYLHNLNSIHISYGGFIESFRGFRAVDAFRRVVNFIQKDYPNIICRISNDNICALKIALSANMRIIGIRTEEGITYIELLGALNGYNEIQTKKKYNNSINRKEKMFSV